MFCWLHSASRNHIDARLQPLVVDFSNTILLSILHSAMCNKFAICAYYFSTEKKISFEVFFLLTLECWEVLEMSNRARKDFKHIGSLSFTFAFCCLRRHDTFLVLNECWLIVQSMSIGKLTEIISLYFAVLVEACCGGGSQLSSSCWSQALSALRSTLWFIQFSDLSSSPHVHGLLHIFVVIQCVSFISLFFFRGD